jgi:hypothetical protein
VVPIILNFKGFSMRNLQYQIRICQKSHKTVTITVYVVRILMKQTLRLQLIFDQWLKLHLGLDVLSNQKILNGSKYFCVLKVQSFLIKYNNSGFQRESLLKNGSPVDRDLLKYWLFPTSSLHTR